MRSSRLRPLLALAVTAAVVVEAVGGLPAANPSTTDPDRLVVAAATWLVRAIAAYLLGVVGLAALVAVVSGDRSMAARAARWSPRCLRGLLAVAVGAGVSTPAIRVLPAHAAASSPGHRRPAARISVTWPTTPRGGHARIVPTAPAPTRTTVTVRPGDCLWSIAATSLGRRGSDARVAAAWPRWWRANRGVIGADPDLIRPGERLTPPSARSSS